jgi:NADPH-dependent 2,4-dienoyl-CoA reductase/sulfur reductase-like enzyme
MKDGSKVDYDYLVVAAGMQIDWDKIPGLVDGLQKEDSGVVSIYDYRYADKTWKAFLFIKDQPSKYIFTYSPPVLKCAGAPQKIMWLIEDTLRGSDLRDKADISYWTPGGSMFGVKHYSDKLEQIRQDRGVTGMFNHLLLSIDSDKKIATFQNKETNETVDQSYDFMHVAPHMSSPDFLKNAPISDEQGWVDVDKHTLQSKKYQNVFGLGDCANTPNSKTAAAITSQAPIVVHNLLQLLDGKPLDAKYSGYASCPLIVAQKRVILAEFGYGGKLMETFSRETGKRPLKYIGTDGAAQYRFFYFLKEQVFPFVYWNLWTRGMWYGTNGPIKPDVSGKGDKTGLVEKKMMDSK